MPNLMNYNKAEAPLRLLLGGQAFTARCCRSASQPEHWAAPRRLLSPGAWTSPNRAREAAASYVQVSLCTAAIKAAARRRYQPYTGYLWQRKAGLDFSSLSLSLFPLPRPFLEDRREREVVIIKSHGKKMKHLAVRQMTNARCW